MDRFYSDLNVLRPASEPFDPPASDDPIANREGLGKWAGILLIASILLMGFVGFCMACGMANEQARIERETV